PVAQSGDPAVRDARRPQAAALELGPEAAGVPADELLVVGGGECHQSVGGSLSWRENTGLERYSHSGLFVSIGITRGTSGHRDRHRLDHGLAYIYMDCTPKIFREPVRVDSDLERRHRPRTRGPLAHDRRAVGHDPVHHHGLVFTI